MASGFVILDRDGTLIEERHYLADPKQVVLLPGVGSALRSLRDLALKLIVISNQSGIGRGYFNWEKLRRVDAVMEQYLSEEGIALDGTYYCPHHPDNGCICRKPGTGLVDKAVLQLGLDLRQCYVIGDRASDVELGKNIGATTFLVRTGYGEKVALEEQHGADFTVDNLKEASGIIRGFLRATKSS
jgi:D-glycero-D-manno-heptose 1,7-bisphosphate phosphatase